MLLWLRARTRWGGVPGSSTKCPRGAKPSTPFPPLLGWPYPRRPSGSCPRATNEQRRRYSRSSFLSAPQRHFPRGSSFYLSPYLIVNFSTCSPGSDDERHLAFRNRLASCGQWGNQMPFQVLSPSGGGAGIAALARPRRHCAKPHAE